MNRIIIYLIVLIGISSPAGTDILPVIVLHEGLNRIALTVVNQSGGDLSGMTVTIDKRQLPGWLAFEGIPNAVDVRIGEKGQDKLYITLIVTGATAGIGAEILFTFEDFNGNRWSYTAPIRVASGAPLAYALYENFPNPFNPSTTIRYSLKEAQHTKLTVFNSLGQKIRTLVDEPQSAGVHAIKWNGHNDSGGQVSSGVYFYRIEAGNFVQTKRMMLIE